MSTPTTRTTPDTTTFSLVHRALRTHARRRVRRGLDAAPVAARAMELAS
mgnify:CR=1 FL=1